MGGDSKEPPPSFLYQRDAAAESRLRKCARYFFTTRKELESKKTKIFGWSKTDAAHKVIVAGRKRHREEQGWN